MKTLISIFVITLVMIFGPVAMSQSSKNDTTVQIDTTYSKGVFLGNPYIYITVTTKEQIIDTCKICGSWEIHHKDLFVPIKKKFWFIQSESMPYVELPFHLLKITQIEIDALMKGEKVRRDYYESVPLSRRFFFFYTEYPEIEFWLKEKKDYSEDFRYDVVSIMHNKSEATFGAHLLFFVFCILFFYGFNNTFIKTNDKIYGIVTLGITSFVVCFTIFLSLHNLLNLFISLLNMPNILIAFFTFSYLVYLFRKKNRKKKEISNLSILDI